MRPRRSCPCDIRRVQIRWLTAFIDRPAATFDDTIAFWLAVTGSTLSARRGEDGQFATLVAQDGDAHLRVQRVADGPGGSHLDLHVDDVPGATDEAIAAGATIVHREDGLTILRSPGGLTFCLVRDSGERARARPRTEPGTGAFLVDQLCVDIPHAAYDVECAFWARLTGWPFRHYRPVHEEFGRLGVPDDLPVKLLLQRRDDDDGPARCHLDIASEDRDALVAWMVAQGAREVVRRELWTVMTDPAGIEFCVTRRDPR